MNSYLTPGIFWQYYRDQPALKNAGDVINFSNNDNNNNKNNDNYTNVLFKFKGKSAGQKRNDGTQDVEIMIPLKYLSNIWRTLEMPLINWSEK